MGDYSYLGAAAVTAGTTAEYVFTDIPGLPSIMLAPSLDMNPVFLDLRLRMALDSSFAPMPNRADPDRPTAAEIKAEDQHSREDDRILIAKSCARGWGRAPKDINGVSHDFTVDECLAFFRALPDHMFDPVRRFCMNVRNFAGPVIVPEPAELGNESQSA